MSQRGVHADSDAYQDRTHSLVYFVLKYLQQIPRSMAANNSIENPVLLINIFAARCLLDFFDHEGHVERMKIFLHKQLRKIKFPWIEHIVVANLDLGDRLPEIEDVLKPWIDEHGLWSQLKISYDGQLQLTLNVKLRWIRKTRLSYQHSDETVPRSSPKRSPKREQQQQQPRPVKRSWRQRLWPPRNWFQRQRSRSGGPKHTIGGKPIPEKIDTSPSSPRVTKTTLVIKFELNHLHGIVLFNIPPSPSDRLWISFLDMPEMKFSAATHLGEYRVSFYKIKEKLEKKLRQMFRRYLVMPNMKDIVLPKAKDYLGDSGFVSTTLGNAKAKEHLRQTSVSQ